MARLLMPRPVPVLTGQIITLHPIDPARDAAGYYRMNLDPQMHTWTGNDVLPSIDTARDELERFVAMDDVTMWAIIDNATGAMAGRFFVTLEEREGLLISGEGNRIARRFWRKGHNREARQLVFRYVFNVLGADVIETECWTGNTNSLKSLKAHGFSFVSEETAYNSRHAKEMPKSRFRMTRQRWLDLYR
jgi:[ribosomal protein S5]-alanine N-acetyltransferase